MASQIGNDKVDASYRRRGIRTKAMTPLSSSTSDISPSSSSSASAAVATVTGVRMVFGMPLEANTARVLSPSDSASVCTTLDSASLSSASVSPSVLLHERLCHIRDSSASKCMESSKQDSLGLLGEDAEENGEGASDWPERRFGRSGEATRPKLVTAVVGVTHFDSDDSVGWTVRENWDEDDEGADPFCLVGGDGVRAGDASGRPWGEVDKGGAGRFELSNVEATGGAGVSSRGKKLKRGFGRGWMGML
jgi:hypothetical protein